MCVAHPRPTSDSLLRILKKTGQKLLRLLYSSFLPRNEATVVTVTTELPIRDVKAHALTRSSVPSGIQIKKAGHPDSACARVFPLHSLVGPEASWRLSRCMHLQLLQLPAQALALYTHMRQLRAPAGSRSWTVR
jgi:hypothetical protein